MKNSLKGKKPLKPRKVVKVEGKIHYSESNQSWNIIKLKTEFLNEFRQLREKSSKFSYELIFGRNEKEMIEALKGTMKNKHLMPILMFLYRD